MKVSIKNIIWKVNVDKRLHIIMKEITRRKRFSSGKLTADQYESAIDAYLFEEKIPKQIEKIERTSVRFKISEECADKVDALRKIARKQKRSLSAILEEALIRYVDKPENYLGKNYNERNKKRLEVI